MKMDGLSVMGDDFFGVYQPRGKLPNVLEASYKQIVENEEFQNFMKILGLNHKEHKSVKPLRYGHLMILPDQVSCFKSLNFTFVVPSHNLGNSIRHKHLILYGIVDCSVYK